MFRVSHLARHLPQWLPTGILGTARPKLVSEPDVFIPAIKLGERDTLARPARKLSDIFTQQRNFCTNPEGTNRKVYRNRHGEIIVFSPCDPPPGYEFVPSGNVFLTRRCRKLAQEIYAVYRTKSRKRHATQIGIFAPTDAFEQAISDFKAKRARIDEKLWRTLDKEYPNIPPADKNKLHCLISSQCPTITGKGALDCTSITVYAYVRDRYTRFKSLAPYGKSQDAEAIAQVHQKVEEILASWCGEGSGEKETNKSRRGGVLGRKGSKP